MDTSLAYHAFLIIIWTAGLSALTWFLTFLVDELTWSGLRGYFRKQTLTEYDKCRYMSSVGYAQRTGSGCGNALRTGTLKSIKK